MQHFDIQVRSAAIQVCFTIIHTSIYGMFIGFLSWHTIIRLIPSRNYSFLLAIISKAFERISRIIHLVRHHSLIYTFFSEHLYAIRNSSMETASITLSKYLKSLILVTLGLKGGFTCFNANLSHSIPLKNSWRLISKGLLILFAG